MRFKVLQLLMGLLMASVAWGNGVAILNGAQGLALRLESSHATVAVENQVAVTTSTQVFRNDFDSPKHFKLAFPLAEQASAIGLRWYMDGLWHESVISPSPADTTLPGGSGMAQDLRDYLGPTPLYFEIDDPLQVDSLLLVELSYVELLPYAFGNVSYSFPNDYELIQTAQLSVQEFSFELLSERGIESILLLSHAADETYNDTHFARVSSMEYESTADQDYRVQYSLDLDQLGLFSLSTFLNDSAVPDELGNGSFVFVAEPDPDNTTNVIQKVFTLIVDRSGSMAGGKIVQARHAAEFIVEHLNEGDRFNIVDFATEIRSYAPEHLEFNTANESSALTYISSLQAGGGTNISGAFSTAIPQFATANDSTANITIFFTDGQATVGLTQTQQILDHVENLVQQNETQVMLFTFGIGSSVNEQLLSLLANDNNGLSEFLGADELEERITDFYLRIRNPVLLNTEISFSQDVIAEVYPEPLPNLYIGQQMILAGRYNQPGPVTVTLSGTAFGQDVSFDYELALSDSADAGLQFLPKVWAKKKIEHLLIIYYSLDEGSQEAQSILAELISISVSCGVVTPFTSFSEGEVGIEEDEFREQLGQLPQLFQLPGNYPNPFNPETTIRLQVNRNLQQIVKIRIYNTLGQLVRELTLQINGAGLYELTWDGTFANGMPAPSGAYVYTVDTGEGLLAGRMLLLK